MSMSRRVYCQDGSLRFSVAGQHKEDVVGVAFSSDGVPGHNISLGHVTSTSGRMVATGCKDRSARIFSTEDGQLLQTFSMVCQTCPKYDSIFHHSLFQEARCYAVAFAPNRPLLAVGDDSNKV